MRIGLVVGRLSLRKAHPALAGKRYVLAVPQGLAALRGEAAPPAEELVALDDLGAAPGTLIAFSEGGEAAAPFHPEKKPVDAYAAALLDHLGIDHEAADALRSAEA